MEDDGKGGGLGCLGLIGAIGMAVANLYITQARLEQEVSLSGPALVGTLLAGTVLAVGICWVPWWFYENRMTNSTKGQRLAFFGGCWAVLPPLLLVANWIFWAVPRKDLSQEVSSTLRWSSGLPVYTGGSDGYLLLALNFLQLLIICGWLFFTVLFVVTLARTEAGRPIIGAWHTEEGLLVEWKAVPNATQYMVCCHQWQIHGTDHVHWRLYTEEPSATFTDLEPDEWHVRVCGLAGKREGPLSSEVVVDTREDED